MAIARRCKAALLVGMLVYGTSSLPAADDAGTWPQWRGPKPSNPAFCDSHDWRDAMSENDVRLAGEWSRCRHTIII